LAIGKRGKIKGEVTGSLLWKSRSRERTIVAVQKRKKQKGKRIKSDIFINPKNIQKH